MKTVFLISFAFVSAGIVSSLQAASVDEGKAKASVCMSCHGKDGASVGAVIPNLAGQKEGYIAKQLKAFKDGSRKDPLMSAIAAQLDDKDVENLAAFWNSLPGAAGTAKSEIPANIAKSRVAFPENYQKDFTYYMTINFPATKQVRKYYANNVALKAAREGKPVTHGAVMFVEAYTAKLDDAKNPVMGSDGFYAPDKLIFYTAMETESGWGNDFPDMLRNADWNYAVFTADKKQRPGVNQAECLACHKPLTKDSYLFSINALQAKAKTTK
jgi:cytochrome c553